MHQRGIAVEGKDDGLVLGEQCVVIGIGQAVGVLGVRFQLHQVNDVDYTDLQLRQCVTQNGDSGQRFQRGCINSLSFEGEEYESVILESRLALCSNIKNAFATGRENFARP